LTRSRPTAGPRTATGSPAPGRRHHDG
jgi:hypothetical protein